MRSRADIERDLTSQRRERLLYVSPQGVAKCHALIDSLLDEWEQASEPAETATILDALELPA
jgi:hypothetical protein